MNNPYRTLPPRAFWRSAVAGRAPDALDALWSPKFPISSGDAIVTAGSCFAQHISRALVDRGMHWVDAEPAPPEMDVAQRRERSYGIFSFRTGNIYTARMLRQWLDWALGGVPMPQEAWLEDGGVFDPFRPAIEPAGFATVQEMQASRLATCRAIADALSRAQCLVFTLGLTEGWEHRHGGHAYPLCPGTARGAFDPDAHRFRNQTFQEVHDDLVAAIERIRAVNAGIRVLLTVSPVPLTATASGSHVLPATIYSKSVLRAVAGQLAAERDDVDYFPSYEMISAFPAGTAFYAPNLRTVTAAGVAFAMRQFFDGISGHVSTPAAVPSAAAHLDDLVCEEAILDYYRQQP
ncbi:GSCFA domain-containing protein [Ramlibacter sp.]|uniref:GSCFA domain-containing protein n=1 Tax=Ramlibacter sp. TaxID=1917967 RepID=UPI0017D7A21D|nr:GSCFA domain-containing protein [Ramlibacter sp.]MBA2672562.1 GSCFA domain-containing protein [Ramlibacter sp.]